MEAKNILFTLLLISSVGFGMTNYEPYHAPPQNIDLGNPYNVYTNPYNTTHHNMPYSEFQNPYSPNSGRNSEKYEKPMYNQEGNFQGKVSIQVTHINAVTNPYGEAANEFNPHNALYNYNPKNTKYPYNDFQNPYDDESGRNDPVYATQVTGNDKHSMGALQPPTYWDKRSTLNPYGPKGNVYNQGSPQDPYYEYYYINSFQGH